MADARKQAWWPKKRKAGRCSSAASNHSNDAIEMVDFKAMSETLMAESDKLFAPLNSDGV